VIGRGAEERTFKVILKAVRAYFKVIFKTEQIYEYIVNALKTLVNLIITISSITNISI